MSQNTSLDLFKTPKALDSMAHRELRFSPSQPYHFAAQQLFAPITLSEASMIAREYAIVFSDQLGSLPMALLGRARGQNLYVRASGHWAARYVPAHIRRYPFVMAEGPLNPETPEKAEKFIMFDTEAPHLAQAAGARLLDDEGKPTDALKSVVQVLGAMEKDNVYTLQAMSQLEDMKLLVARQINIPSQHGQPVGLTGLRVIDMERFHALAPEQLAALRDTGALGLIYAHEASLSNLRDSVLTQSDAAAPSTSSGSISFEGIDWSKF